MKPFMHIDAKNNGENNGEKKCRVSHTHRLHYYIYVNKRGKQKTIQTIHKTLHDNYIQNPARQPCADSPLASKTIQPGGLYCE